VHLAKQLEALIPELLRIVRPGDAVLTLGAGSIGSIPPRLIEALKADLPASARKARAGEVSPKPGDGGKVRRYSGQRSDG
jgi:hypothetical protein